MITYNEVKDRIEDVMILRKSAIEVTINAGVVAVTQDNHSIDTELDAATDDLDTINGGIAQQSLQLVLENNVSIVTLKHGTGNLLLPDGNDIVMVPDGIVTLFYDGTNWKAATGSGGGGGGEANTASNQGVGGIGVFDNKNLLDLEMRNIIAKSTKIAVTLNGANKEIEVDAIEANFSLTNIGGTLSIAKGGTGQTAKTAAFNSLSPITTKGDLISRDVTNNIRLGIGAAGQVLTVDAAEATGMKWATPAGGTDANAIHDNVANEISGITEKVSPVNADLTIIEDSAAGFVKKKVQLGNLSVAALGEYVNIDIPASAMTPTLVNGALAVNLNYSSNDINVAAFQFDPAAEKTVQFAIKMPDKWDLGTVKFKFYWDGDTAATGDADWGVKAGALSNDDAIDSALFGTEVEVTDTLLAVGDLNISSATAAVTVAGTPALEDMTFFEIALKTTSTLTQDALLLGISMQYKEKDTTPTIW